MNDIYKVNPEHAVYKKVCLCGEKKECGQSFCRRCSLRLPKELSQELWRTFAMGYAIHWAKARNWLLDEDAPLTSDI